MKYNSLCAGRYPGRGLIHKLVVLRLAIIPEGVASPAKGRRGKFGTGAGIPQPFQHVRIIEEGGIKHRLGANCGNAAHRCQLNGGLTGSQRTRSKNLGRGVSRTGDNRRAGGQSRSGGPLPANMPDDLPRGDRGRK
jgi:hypothetical protein